jgi:hypothetical protein
LSDSQQHTESNFTRSSSEIRAASSDLGIIGIEKTRLSKLRLSSRYKAFFNFEKHALSGDSSKRDQTLKNALIDRSWKDAEPKNIIVGLYSKTFSLIPASLYEVHQPFPEISIDSPAENQVTFYDSLTDLDLIVQFNTSPDITELIKKHCPKAQIKFLYSGWLIGMQMESRNEDFLVGIHSAEDHMALAIFKNAQLQLFNTYPKKNGDDVSYFGLYAIQKLDIPAHNCRLMLSSVQDEESALQDIFNRYLSKVELAVPSKDFKSIPKEFFNSNYPLSRLYLCV